MWRTRLGWGLCRVKNEFWLSWPNLYPPVEPWVEGLLRKVSKDAIYPSSTGPGRAKRSPLAGRNTSDWLILQKENKNIRIINGYKINFILFSNSKFGTRCLIPLIWDSIFFFRFSCSLEHGILIWTFKNDLWYVRFIYLSYFFWGGGGANTLITVSLSAIWVKLSCKQDSIFDPLILSPLSISQIFII